MKLYNILFILALFNSGVVAQTNNIDKIVKLINDGSYKEAAMQLRPLAEGGDAEAQRLAASLFFSGKGVVQSDEQGLKYVRKSVEQGYFNAFLLYCSYCRNKDNRDEAVSIFEKYIVPNKNFQNKVISYFEGSEDLEYCLNAFLDKDIFADKQEIGEFACVDKLYKDNPAKGEFVMEYFIKKYSIKHKYPLNAFVLTLEEIAKELNFNAESLNIYEKAAIAYFAVDKRVITKGLTLAHQLAKEADAEGSVLARYVLRWKFTEAELAEIETNRLRDSLSSVILEEGEYDIKPEFPGGDSAMEQFFAKKFKGSSSELKNAVIANLTVNSSGEIIKIDLINSPSDKISTEIKKAFSAFPSFKAAKYKGVNASCILRIVIGRKSGKVGFYSVGNDMLRTR